jgi:hypothetical protein
MNLNEIESLAKQKLNDPNPTIARQAAAALTEIQQSRSPQGLAQAYFKVAGSNPTGYMEQLGEMRSVSPWAGKRTWTDVDAEAKNFGTVNGQKTWDRQLNEANATGKLNGQRTLAGQQFDQNAAQQKLDNQYRQQTFDYQKGRDTVADQKWQAGMNLDLRKQSFSEAQSQIENALRSRQISQADADVELARAKFLADQDPNSLDNKIKQANLDILNGGKITDSQLREKAAALAKDSLGNFDASIFDQVYNALKGGTTSTTPYPAQSSTQKPWYMK